MVKCEKDFRYLVSLWPYFNSDFSPIYFRFSKKGKMKFMCLLSGGKDSCYNLMQCLNDGHELECLANLRPKESIIGILK